MLAFSQTISYAVQALGCLAQNAGRWHQAQDISRCTGVPKPYLAKVLHKLGGAGLVITKRGYRGGYSLANPSSEISLLEVVRVLDDSSLETRCLLGDVVCSDERACPMHDYWMEQRAEITRRLAALTLDDMSEFEEFKAQGCCHCDSKVESASSELLDTNGSSEIKRSKKS